MGVMVGIGSGNGPRPARASALMARWVPARAVLALLFGATAKRLGYSPTWVVLTLGCRAGGGWDEGCVPGKERQGPWDEERRAGAAVEGLWCDIPRSVCASSPRGGGGVQSR